MDILAVVDDLLLGSKVSGTLSQSGHTVRMMANPTQALAHAREKKPSLVIVDLGIQHGDPFEMIRSIKSELGLPVIAYTNHTDVTGLEKAATAGADKVAARSEFFANMTTIVGSYVR